MTQFIQVSRSSDREDLILNVDAIELVREGQNCRIILIRGHGCMDDDRQIRVNETYAEICVALGARLISG
jgi:hypothetical protein